MLVPQNITLVPEVIGTRMDNFRGTLKYPETLNDQCLLVGILIVLNPF